MLAAAGQRLVDRGCVVELTNVGCCGEPDMRLLVGRAGRPVSVEVLGPYGGAGPAGRWSAVRVDPDGARCVWAGRCRSCPPEPLATFVDDLLGEDPRALAGRYIAIGQRPPRSPQPARAWARLLGSRPGVRSWPNGRAAPRIAVRGPSPRQRVQASLDARRRGRRWTSLDPFSGAGRRGRRPARRSEPAAVAAHGCGSADAVTAERLQFTVGNGPCLGAASTGRPVVATEALLGRRWPVFRDLLVSRTALRSAVSLRLPGPMKGLGGMDCYFTGLAGAAAIDLHQVRHVAELVAERLGPAADWAAWAPSRPTWIQTPEATRRGRLWMAVGVLILALGLPAPDALALLRARAYATGRTADDLADQLLERRLQPEQLLEEDR